LIGNAANNIKLVVMLIELYCASGLMTGAQLNSEFRPYYQVRGNYMYWHDCAVIKLNYLFESLNKTG
jgi:hypothetical protein